MTTDVTSALANFMLGKNKCLPGCLRKQDELLEQVECTDLETGKWLEDFEKPVLIEILNSPDSYFFERFPELKSFSRPERQKLAEKVQAHVNHCEHCQLKVRFDSEWENEVETAICDYRMSSSNNTNIKNDKMVSAPKNKRKTFINKA